jgi:hypothetical protein
MFKLSRTDIHPQQTYANIDTPTLYKQYLNTPLTMEALPQYTNTKVLDKQLDTSSISEGTYIPSLDSVLKNVVKQPALTPATWDNYSWDTLKNSQVWLGGDNKVYTNDPYLNAVIAKESGRDPNAVNGDAKGIYQFTTGTWHDYGEGDESQRTDIQAAHRAVVKMTRERMNGLIKAGYAPTPDNVYLTHLLGLGGALKLLKNMDSRMDTLYLGKNYTDSILGNLSKEDRAYYSAHPEELTARRFKDIHGNKLKSLW